MFLMYPYRIGLIEWMENTCTLKDLLLRTRTEEEQQTVTRYSSTRYAKNIEESTTDLTGDLDQKNVSFCLCSL